MGDVRHPSPLVSRPGGGLMLAGHPDIRVDIVSPWMAVFMLGALVALAWGAWS